MNAHRYDPFPPDGDWTRSAWLQEVAPEHACPRAISDAISALLPLFPPCSVRHLETDGPRPHPFTWHYAQRGGVRLLLTLGRCLSLIGSPAEIVSDIAHPARYMTRFSEAWAGALFVRLGARVQFIGEHELGGKRPEFVASFPDGSQFSVEVKGLQSGEKEHWNFRTILAFQEGIWESQWTVELPSRADVQPPLETLQTLALEQNEHALQVARSLGREVGRRWSEFLDDHPQVGLYVLSSNLTVEVLPEHERAKSGQNVMRGLSLPDLHDFHRLRRKALPNASGKFVEHQNPGILILEKPLSRRWDPRDLRKLQSELSRPASWAHALAAVLIKYEIHLADGYHDRVRLLPGLQANTLPSCFAEKFPACGGCGERHADVDFLRKG